MKRILSLILALMLSAALLPSARAASNEEALAAANELHELGLFNGTGTDANGNPVYELDRAPSRHEAVTMLVRLLGKDADANNGAWSLPFTDVTAWARPYVGYAYTNGLTAGTSATTFGGEATVTAAQYITFVLRALGYESGTDFQWDSSWELSDRLGVTAGQYNAETTVFTRGDVAVISRNALSVPCKNGGTLRPGSAPSNPADPAASSLASQMLGYWEGLNYADDGEYKECYLFEKTKYSCAYQCVSKQSRSVIYTGYEEGTWSVSGDSVVLKRTGGQDYVEATGQTVAVEPREGTHSVKIYAGQAMFLSSWVYQRMDDAEKTYSSFKDYIAGKQTQSGSVNSADYSYLAGTDFRHIQRKYSSAVGQCGYVYAYRNLDGDLCVLTYVQYKIKSSYSEFSLRNMTTGAVTYDPDGYYETLAGRAYGASRLHYMDLRSEVLGYEIKMLEAARSCVAGGSNTWNGVYITAAELNL